jgi:serine/threonine protein phosphatase PrpC
MTGYREEMQDRHILKLNVLEDIDNPEYEKYAVNTANEFVACFSVFDGHGGSLCSTKVKRTLVKNLMEEQYKKRLEIIKHELANGASVGDRALYTALQTKFSWLENDNDFVNAFLKTDHDILLEQVQSGATGTVCIILPDQDFRKKGLLSGSNMVPIQHG